MKNHSPLNLPNDYSAWLSDLKQRICASQQKAVIAVNQELILLYMRAFANSWTKDEIVQQPVGQLTWYPILRNSSLPLNQIWQKNR